MRVISTAVPLLLDSFYKLLRADDDSAVSTCSEGDIEFPYVYVTAGVSIHTSQQRIMPHYNNNKFLNI